MLQQILLSLLITTTITISAQSLDGNLEEALTVLPKCCTKGLNRMIYNKCTEESPNDPVCPYGRFVLKQPQMYFTNGTLYEYSLTGPDYNLMNLSLCLTVRERKEVQEIIALVCFDPYDEDVDFNGVGPMKISSPRILACLTSIAFALVTITVYGLVPDLRDLQGKCTMSFLVSMAMGYLLLTITQLDSLNLPLQTFGCELQAFSLLFWMLAQFFWLNVVCINMWRNVKLNLQIDDNNMYLIYNIYAWGMPALLVGITIILQYIPDNFLTPGIGEKNCWLKGDQEYWTFFYGPILLLLVINTVLFIVSGLHLWKDYSNLTPSTKIVAHRYKCLLYAKLFMVMGITWLMEPVAFLADKFKDDPREQYLLFLIFDYINLLQGLFSFIILVITRKRALRGLARASLFGFRCAPASWATLQRLEEEYDEDEQRTIDENSPEIKITQDII